MRLVASIDVVSEDGQDLIGPDVAKDLKIYLMDFANNIARLKANDIEGGFHVTQANVTEIW